MATHYQSAIFTLSGGNVAATIFSRNEANPADERWRSCEGAHTTTTYALGQCILFSGGFGQSFFLSLVCDDYGDGGNDSGSGGMPNLLRNTLIGAACGGFIGTAVGAAKMWSRRRRAQLPAWQELENVPTVAQA
jgi:hypothetical protein